MADARWAGDPSVGVVVLIGTHGPLDPPDAGTYYNVTDRGGQNYVMGEPGIAIRRGRSDEFSEFQAGTATFVLRNNGREFDPALTEIAVDLPAVAGATASTPDIAAFAPAGDLDIRVRLSMDDWTPGGFGRFILAQWPNVAGSNAWLLGLTAAGFPQLSFTTDGTTTQNRVATVLPNFADGSVHWLRAVLDVDNGAAGHDVIFYTSDDGVTWTQIGATVTTAGTVTVFNTTAALAFGDVLNLGGQVYRGEFRNNNLLVASPDFSTQQPGTETFVDDQANTWTVNGTASIGYDDHASVFAPILKPRRRVLIYTGRVVDFSSIRLLFAGYLEGWPQAWTATTGTVEIVAHDLLSVLAQTTVSEGSGVLVLDDPHQGRLDFGRLGGDLPQQTTGERIATVAGLAGISTQLLDLDTGLTEVAGLEPTGDALSLCQEAVAAEAGFLFVDANGEVTFLDRHSRFRNDRLSTTQATFTDSEYSGMSVACSTAQMWNVAKFTRPALEGEEDPLEQVATDAASVAELGRRTYPASGATSIPVLSDAETLARAEFWVQRYARPRQRPSPVVVKLRRDVDGMFDRVTRRELLDRVRLERTPQGLGPTTRFTGLVEQIEHRITRSEWDTTIGISPIDVDEGGTFLILDDSTQGQLDQESLSY